MFRRIIAIILFAVFAAGCSVSINTSKASSPSKSPSSTASSVGAGVGTPSARESMFPGFVHDHISKTLVLSNDQLVGFGKQVCTGLDTLQPTSSLEIGSYINGYAIGLKGSLTRTEAVKFVGYSIAAFCPKYEELMQ